MSRRTPLEAHYSLLIIKHPFHSQKCPDLDGGCLFIRLLMSQPHTVSLSWLMLIYCDLLTKNLTCGAAVIGRSVKGLPWKKKDLRVLRIQFNKRSWV